MARNGTLSTKQNKTIGIILSAPNITRACEMAGIGRSTICRWLKEDAFKSALVEAENELLQDASRALLSGQTGAIKTIRDIMTNGATDAVKLKAANDWLGNLFKYRELATLENRVTALEERLSNGDTKNQN